jgi:hypothetical protein
VNTLRKGDDDDDDDNNNNNNNFSKHNSNRIYIAHTLSFACCMQKQLGNRVCIQVVTTICFSTESLI